MVRQNMWSGSVCPKRLSRKNGGQRATSTKAVTAAARLRKTRHATQAASAIVPASKSPWKRVTIRRPSPNTA
jgi:hypothetical protein